MFGGNQQESIDFRRRYHSVLSMADGQWSIINDLTLRNFPPDDLDVFNDCGETRSGIYEKGSRGLFFSHLASLSRKPVIPYLAR